MKKSFFSPAIALMNRLPYGRKFALLGALSLLTITLLAGMLYVELNVHIRLIRHEQEGLRLVAPLSRVIQLTQQHRGLSSAILSGGTWMRDGFPVIDRTTDEAFHTLDAALPVQLRSRTDWQDIMQHWQQLHGAMPEGAVAENFRKHLQIVKGLEDFESVIADEYELTLDPEFDTYYLIDTVIDRLPDALEHFGQLRAKGTSALVRKQVNDQQKLELYGILQQLKDALVSLNTNLEKTGRYNQSLREAHAAVFSDIAASTRYLVEVINQDIIPGRFETRPEAFFAACTAAIDSDYDKIYRVLLPTAEKLLQQRIDRAQTGLYATIGLALLLFLLGGYLSIGIALSVADSVRMLALSARAFVDGDLDERVQIETRDELRQAGDSFNEMAENFNSMLKARTESEAALRRSNADLTRFSEVSAHHLMEPVRRMGLYSQRLRAYLPEAGKNEEVRSSLDTIERDAAYLRSLVRDIQLYLAASEPRGEVRQEDANAVFATVEERMAQKLAQAGASLIKVAPLPPAMLDRPRLLDLFSVLLDNALQYGRPSDPAVAQRIFVSGEREGALSRYAISDNGPGIPAQYQERVFGIFERLAPRGKEGGSGIGLSIARRIVENRGGRIWIENIEEGGAKVVFELPDGG